VRLRNGRARRGSYRYCGRGRLGLRHMRFRSDKLGRVRTFMDHDASFARVRGVFVVLREALAKFAGGYANDRVGIGIVVGRPSEDLDAERSFAEGFVLMVERPFGDVTQECAIALALAEQRIGEKAVDLGALLTN